MGLSIYYYATGPVAGSANAQNIVSIANPAASTARVAVTRVVVNGVLTVASLTAAVYRVGRTTGEPASGSTQTPTKQLTSQDDPQAVIRTGPTATMGGLIWSSSPGVILALGAGAFPITMEQTESPIGGPLVVLAPGEGLLVAADANLTTWTHYVSMTWTEL